MTYAMNTLASFVAFRDSATVACSLRGHGLREPHRIKHHCQQAPAPCESAVVVQMVLLMTVRAVLGLRSRWWNLFSDPFDPARAADLVSARLGEPVGQVAWMAPSTSGSDPSGRAGAHRPQAGPACLPAGRRSRVPFGGRCLLVSGRPHTRHEPEPIVRLRRPGGPRAH